jgi:hypothetical protein
LVFQFLACYGGCEIVKKPGVWLAALLSGGAFLLIRNAVIRLSGTSRSETVVTIALLTPGIFVALIGAYVMTLLVVIGAATLTTSIWHFLFS